jgi:hypothetical protein
MDAMQETPYFCKSMRNATQFFNGNAEKSRKKQKIAELTPVHLRCVGPRCSDYQSKKAGVAGSIPITSTTQSYPNRKSQRRL